MNDPLIEIQHLLDNFEDELSTIRSIWKQLEIDNPSFDQVSEGNWQEKQARMWLHGATDAWECNELERWLYDSPLLTEAATLSASNVKRSWRNKLKRKEPFGAYYIDFNEFQIPRCKKNEQLIHFLLRLAKSTENDGKGHRLEWRALKSFLDFLRKKYSTKQVAFIEHIFPKKMDLHFGQIIRLISPEAYPIPEKTAAEILMELARRCRSGRPDAQYTAIDSLALCLLCIAASRIRFPKTLEMIRGIKSTAVLSGAEFSISTMPTFGGDKFWRPLVDGDFSVLLVPTLFGEQPLKISNRWCAFLKAVTRIKSQQPRETILHKPKRSLTRMFDEVLKSVKPNPKYGNITYLSLLNQPHIFGDHRYQPKHLKTNA